MKSNKSIKKKKRRALNNTPLSQTRSLPESQNLLKIRTPTENELDVYLFEELKNPGKRSLTTSQTEFLMNDFELEMTKSTANFCFGSKNSENEEIQFEKKSRKRSQTKDYDQTLKSESTSEDDKLSHDTIIDEESSLKAADVHSFNGNLTELETELYLDFCREFETLDEISPQRAPSTTNSLGFNNFKKNHKKNKKTIKLAAKEEEEERVDGDNDQNRVDRANKADCSRTMKGFKRAMDELGQLRSQKVPKNGVTPLITIHSKNCIDLHFVLDRGVQAHPGQYEIEIFETAVFYNTLICTPPNFQGFRIAFNVIFTYFKWFVESNISGDFGEPNQGKILFVCSEPYDTAHYLDEVQKSLIF